METASYRHYSASSAEDYGKLLWRVHNDGQEDQKIA